MATSSALSTNNDNIKYKITITQNSRDVANNTSSVTVSVRFYRTNTGYTTYGTGTVYCKINGTTYSASVTSDDKITSSGIVLFSRTQNIAHDADGGKNLTVSAWISHSQFSASEQSYSLELTAIPRATTPSINDNDVDLGTSITISTPRASTSFTHTLRYAFGSTSGEIASGVATSRSWTIPLSLASQIPKATSGKLTIYCDTYNGTSKIGTKSIGITVRVPSTVVPTISSVAVTDTNNAQYTKLGGVVKGKSSLSVKITASGANGSTISSYSTVVGGKTYAGASYTVSNITSAGTLTFEVTVKDSRGRTAKATKEITVVDYEGPTIDSFKVIRANSDGTPNEEGTSLLITYGFTIDSVNNKNDKSYKLEIKPTDGSAYTTIASGNVYTLSTNVIVSNNISVDKSYTIQLTIADYFRTITHSIEAPTAFTLIDFHSSGKGIGFGKVAETEGVIEFGMDTEFQGPIYGNVLGLSYLPKIPSNANLNNYVNTGAFSVLSNAIAETIANIPVPIAGRFEVANSTGRKTPVTDWAYLRQKFIPYLTDYPTFERNVTRNDSDTWSFGAWVPTTLKKQKILWSGSWYMTSGQKAELSEKISAQPNGIVLVWGRYANGATEESNFNSFFVPKKFVEEKAGLGSAYFMSAVNFSTIASKYLYISDGHITGNDLNSATGTANGITYNNAGYVLRYVLGV